MTTLTQTDPDSQAPSRSFSVAVFASLFVALTLWLLTSCYFLDQLGKYSDDFSLAIRSLDTGEWDWRLHPWTRWPYFWRPLHLAFIFLVASVFWTHDWVLHLISALAHGGCSLALFVLLRRLRLRPLPAALAALLFLTCPLNAEAAHWFSAICNSLGALTLLLTLNLIVQRAQADKITHPRTLAGLGILCFVNACWYEMSAAALACAPLIILAAASHSSSSPSHPILLRRILLPTLACGSACLVYALLLVFTAPAWQRGSAANLASSAGLAQRIVELAREVPDWLLGNRAYEIWRGSTTLGWRTLQLPGNGLRLISLIIIALLLALLIPIVARTVRAAAARTHRRPLPAVQTTVTQNFVAPRRVLIALSGAVVLLASWIPVAVVPTNSIELRLWYTPLLGIAIIIAAALDGFLERVRARQRPLLRWISNLIFATLALVLLTGTLGFIGFQARFRQIWYRDLTQINQLRTAIPNPPAHAVIIPLRTLDVGASTGFRAFDFSLHNALSQSWSCWAMTQFGYRRRDVFATHIDPAGDRAPPLHHFSNQGFWSMTKLVGAYTRDERLGSKIPWDLAIPIGVLSDGSLQFFDQITIERPDGLDITLCPPLTQQLSALDPKLIRPISLPDPADPTPTNAGAWQQSTPTTALQPATSKPVDARLLWEAGAQRLAVNLPLSFNTPSQSIHLPLTAPPGDSHTLITRWTIRRSSIADAVTNTATTRIRIETIITCSDPSFLLANPVSTTTLSVSDILTQRRWLPMRIDVPAGATNVHLNITLITNSEDLATPGLSVLFTPPSWAQSPTFTPTP